MNDNLFNIEYHLDSFKILLSLEKETLENFIDILPKINSFLYVYIRDDWFKKEPYNDYLLRNISKWMQNPCYKEKQNNIKEKNCLLEPQNNYKTYEHMKKIITAFDNFGYQINTLASETGKSLFHDKYLFRDCCTYEKNGEILADDGYVKDKCCYEDEKSNSTLDTIIEKFKIICDYLIRHYNQKETILTNIETLEKDNVHIIYFYNQDISEKFFSLGYNTCKNSENDFENDQLLIYSKENFSLYLSDGLYDWHYSYSSRHRYCYYYRLQDANFLIPCIVYKKSKGPIVTKIFGMFSTAIKTPIDPERGKIIRDTETETVIVNQRNYPILTNLHFNPKYLHSLIDLYDNMYAPPKEFTTYDDIILNTKYNIRNINYRIEDYQKNNEKTLNHLLLENPTFDTTEISKYMDETINQLKNMIEEIIKSASNETNINPDILIQLINDEYNPEIEYEKSKKLII